VGQDRLGRATAHQQSMRGVPASFLNLAARWLGTARVHFSDLYGGTRPPWAGDGPPIVDARCFSIFPQSSGSLAWSGASRSLNCRGKKGTRGEGENEAVNVTPLLPCLSAGSIVFPQSSGRLAWDDEDAVFAPGWLGRRTRSRTCVAPKVCHSKAQGETLGTVAIRPVVSHNGVQLANTVTSFAPLGLTT